MPDGYIYIVGWENFQHPDTKRRATPGNSWIKNYVGLLDNDAYLDLSPFDRCVLHGLWMLAGRTGNGRASARHGHVANALSIPHNHANRSLERLNRAGFIQILASKAQAPRLHTASTEVEGSKEPQKEKKNARARAGRNGTAPAPKEEPDPERLSPEERREEARRALALIHSVEADAK